MHLLRRLSAITTTLALFAMVAASGASFAETRVALVIGNGAYRNAPRLANPPNDAKDVAATLTRSGFKVIHAIDVDKVAMDAVTIAFARAARTADVAIFYYSGHAIQFAGVNYLAPIDAKLTDEADLRRLVRLDDMVADLQQAKNLRILVLDACRDNPLADQLKRSIGSTRSLPLQRGLAKIDTPQGMIVAYATQAGRTAEDGDGRNSPYTAAFLKNIETQEEIGTIFRQVSEDVYEATRHAQLPELSLSLIGKFYLRGKIEVTTKPDRPAARDDNPRSRPSEDPAAQAWAVTKDSTSIAVLDDFIRQFGNTPYGSMARARREELTRVAVTVPPIAPPKAGDPCGAGPQTVSLYARAACPLSAAEERSLAPKDVFSECDKCPELMVVPAGSFTMGSPTSEDGRFSDEDPQHPVTVARQFAVGKFAVTFAEWDACVLDGGCGGYRPPDQGWGRDKQPVINVSWYDAKAYVAWLSKTTGRTYRLLSEAEREYVARAGTTTPFWWGATISTGQANYNPYGSGLKGEFRSRTVPVDSFQPNPWGLYQVHGNVSEWTEDCAHDNYTGAPTNGSAWTTGDCNRRVLRGGSWFKVRRVLRSANRNVSTISSFRDSEIGFRIARTLLTP